MIRGARGAIQVGSNEAGAILSAAEQLMVTMIERNAIQPKNVAAVFFTVTVDLNAVFPAEIRKSIGWQMVPFLCSQEIPVPNSMKRVLRVLILFETDYDQDVVQHCYLGATKSLRPDLYLKDEKEEIS